MGLETMAVREDRHVCPIQIFSLSGLPEISFGSRKGNLVRDGKLEPFQLLLVQKEDGCWYGGKEYGRLTFGRVLSLGEIRLVWLQSSVAVSLGEKTEVEEILRKRQISAVELVQREAKKRPAETSAGGADGTEYFRRSPRGRSILCEGTLSLELPPEHTPVRKQPLLLTAGPALTMSVPMLLGCGVMLRQAGTAVGSGGMYLYLGLVTALSSTGLAFSWTMLRRREDKKQAAETERIRREDYRSYLQGIRKQLSEQVRQNTAALHQLYPPAEECLQYTEKRAELWSRSREDPDFLYVRLGIGRQAFQVQVQIPPVSYRWQKDPLADFMQKTAEDFRWLQNVPVGISLSEYPVLGLAGTGAVRLMQLIAAQLSTACSGAELKMGFFRDRKTTEDRDWDCFRFLPHVWAEDGSRRFLAADTEEAEETMAFLAELFRRRKEESAENSAAVGNLPGFRRRPPHYVLFFQDFSCLRREDLLRYLTDSSGGSTVSFLFLASRVEDLPYYCRSVLISDGVQSRLQGPDQSRETQISFRTDPVSAEQMEIFARRAAGIRTREAKANSTAPGSAGFLELYQACTVEELPVEALWSAGKTWQALRARLGWEESGEICWLDIHEKYHGPHGLIAGATGSGKSVLLETLLLSLAVCYSPEDINFFLIDFKGGGLANRFRGLPHLAGSITNLSGSQVNRALLSIKSENERRQKMLADAGVSHVDAYTRLVKSGRVRAPMPHLLLVIDEFAELKREVPDFMQELVSVAQVGRSLGVHLILATQKPAGVVSDAIWSNSRFHICLRVQSRQDSMDLLHNGDASRLLRPGQAILQVGENERYVHFQTACPEIAYAGEAGRYRGGAVLLDGTGIRVTDPVPPGSTEDELEAVLHRIQEAARKTGIRSRKPLWLPPLPERLYLSQLKKEKRKNGTGLRTMVGMADDPARQRRQLLEVNFSTEGHLAVCGSVVSGKSVFLHTVLTGLLEEFDREHLQVLILDFSSQLLQAFAGREQVLAVVRDGEQEAETWMAYLAEEIAVRKREGVQSRPDVLLVLDQIGAFRRETGSRFDELLEEYVRCGRPLHLYLAVSAAGFGMLEIPSRMAENISQVFCMEQAETVRYLDCLRVNRIPVLPEPGVKGRGLVKVDGRVLEFQTALAGSMETDAEQTAESFEEKS